MFVQTTRHSAPASCNRSLGRVRPRRFGLDPVLSWNLHPDDLPILTRALWVLTEIFFASGAKTVLPGIHGVPPELHSMEDAEVLRSRPITGKDLVLGANHVFCATRMHGDPRRGVVDEYGLCHDFDNLWIVDTGIFPRCPSVNPMWTGMALAHRAARVLADRL